MVDRVDDEMLMAFVDGELDENAASEIRAMMERDADLAARAASFRRSRDLARHAFAGIRGEAPPAAMALAIRQAAWRSASRRRSRFAWASATRGLPMAAALVLALGLGFLAGRTVDSPQSSVGGALLGAGPVAEALGETGGGAETQVAFADGSAMLTTRASYPVGEGICRSFELAGPRAAFVGVGCATEADPWEVNLALSLPRAEAGGYAPASGEALAALDAYLDSREAGPALPPGE